MAAPGGDACTAIASAARSDAGSAPRQQSQRSGSDIGSSFARNTAASVTTPLHDAAPAPAAEGSFAEAHNSSLRDHGANGQRAHGDPEKALEQRKRMRPPHGCHPIGTRLEVHSLVKRTELNGKICVVRGFSSAPDGIPCMVIETEGDAGGTRHALKPRNTRVLASRPHTPQKEELTPERCPSERAASAAIECSPAAARSGCSRTDGPRSDAADDVSIPDPCAHCAHAPPILHGVTDAAAHRRLYEIVGDHCDPSHATWYSQEDVRWHGVRGMLSIVTPRDGADPCRCLVTWLPYCLLMTLNPGQLTLRGRRSLDSLDGLGICDTEGHFSGEFRPEWAHALLIPDRRLLELRKQGKTFGPKSVTLWVCAGEGGGTREAVGPLMFSDGGLAKFLDRLQHFVRLERDAQDESVLVCDTAHSRSATVAASDEFASPDSKSADGKQLGSLHGSFARHAEGRAESPARPEPAPSPYPRPASGLSEPAARDGPGAGASFTSAFAARFRRAESAGARSAPAAPSRPPGGEGPVSPGLEHGGAARPSFGLRMLSSLRAALADDKSPAGSPRPHPDPGDAVQQAAQDPRPHARVLPNPLPPPPRERTAPVDAARWQAALGADGTLSQEQWDALREDIFRGGLHPEARRDAWRYMLGVDEVGSTPVERRERRAQLAAEYAVYRNQWQSITSRQRANFCKFRDRVHRVEKDVLRTDRTVDLYADEDGEGASALRRILISYAFFNFDLGYCQGMSDILSPLYYVLRDEAEAFWAFVHLMDTRVGGNFSRDQLGMTAELQHFAELVRAADPELHCHLAGADALNFYFCFRWVLVQFKREFAFADVLRLWDVLWACPFTRSWHLFLGCTLLRLSKGQIVEHAMGFDEVLKFVNDMSGRVDLDAALSWTAHHYDELALDANGGARRPSLREIIDAYRHGHGRLEITTPREVSSGGGRAAGDDSPPPSPAARNLLPRAAAAADGALPHLRVLLGAEAVPPERRGLHALARSAAALAAAASGPPLEVAQLAGRITPPPPRLH
eukprot:TRINITY_DN2486_c0_g1_i1.p1 TRINITY_DN2486_c0_g1~~TRINITY_DN2486_c0_g1_i1.p1  ORF type:complete len:1025 (+),score=306.39 TRINITY_DN2486_c0_g1_i1:138-3212(+)